MPAAPEPLFYEANTDRASVDWSERREISDETLSKRAKILQMHLASIHELSIRRKVYAVTTCTIQFH